jgi:hypothetical protein
MGSSFTGELPAAAIAATMHHAQNRRGEQQDFPHTEPYAIPRNDTIECLALVGPRQPTGVAVLDPFSRRPNRKS